MIDVDESKPEELTLDLDEGTFTLVNKASKEQSYKVKVTVTNSGGTVTSDTDENVSAEYNPSLIIEEFEIVTQCGPASTVLEIDPLAALS